MPKRKKNSNKIKNKKKQNSNKIKKNKIKYKFNNAVKKKKLTRKRCTFPKNFLKKNKKKFLMKN